VLDQMGARSCISLEDVVTLDVEARGTAEGFVAARAA
jgi:hypothetical protein